MLKSCSKCGGVHEWGVCPKEGIYNQIRYHKKDTEQSKFRSTGMWQRKRNEIKKRDLYLCRLCLDNNRIMRDDLQVHHIVPIKVDESLKLDDNNLITLCSGCHELAEHDKDMIGHLQWLAKSPPYL